MHLHCTQKLLKQLGLSVADLDPSRPSSQLLSWHAHVDLLFYHLKLRRYVVVELKAVAFQPGFAGQMNLYLSAVDDLLRHPDDQPTIGLLLCKGQNKLVVEYALRGMDKPIGVAGWKTQLTEILPKDLKGSLPTVQEIEAELAGDLGTTKKLKKGK